MASEVIYPLAGKPDGMPRKLLDVTRLRGLGWRPSVGLADGIAETYRWFERHEAATTA
jgi:GDP-L-fucose synthase